MEKTGAQMEIAFGAFCTAIKELGVPPTRLQILEACRRTHPVKVIRDDQLFSALTRLVNKGSIQKTADGFRYDFVNDDVVTEEVSTRRRIRDREGNVVLQYEVAEKFIHMGAGGIIHLEELTEHFDYTAEHEGWSRKMTEEQIRKAAQSATTRSEGEIEYDDDSDGWRSTIDPDRTSPWLELAIQLGVSQEEIKRRLRDLTQD